MLFYNSYFPSAHLRSVVARYMIIVDQRKHAEWQQMVIVPNGLPGLGFSIGEQFRYFNAEQQEEHQVSCGNVIGIHNCNYTAKWRDPIDFFVIVFKPLGLYQLLQADMREIRNNLTHFRLMGIKESEWICDQLRKTASPERKIRFIEQWLERKLTGKPPATGLTEQATRTIIEQKGLVLVSELSRQFNVNRKYLERHFSLELGLSPKEFAGIIRFNYLSSLLLEQAISWKELTYLGRFHDQSHLIKHFNRVTGLTPGAFRQMIDEHPEARFVKRHNVYTLVLNDAEEPV